MSFVEFMQTLTYWHWWILAAVLIILEVLASGAFFMWIGIAAAAMGLVTLVFTISWEVQLLLFSVFTVASIIIWRKYFLNFSFKTDQPRLNRRGTQYVGRIFTLDEPITNGQGKIKVDDTTWKIHGEDCAAGSKVVVMDVDGAILRVGLQP